MMDKKFMNTIHRSSGGSVLALFTKQEYAHDDIYKTTLRGVMQDLSL